MNLVIRNVRLIDGTGADPVPRVSLEVTTTSLAELERRRLAPEDASTRRTSMARG